MKVLSQHRGDGIFSKALIQCVSNGARASVDSATAVWVILELLEYQILACARLAGLTGRTWAGGRRKQALIRMVPKIALASDDPPHKKPDQPPVFRSHRRAQQQANPGRIVAHAAVREREQPVFIERPFCGTGCVNAGRLAQRLGQASH